MKGLWIQILLIIAVGFTGILALYLQVPVPSHQQVPAKEQVTVPESKLITPGNPSEAKPSLHRETPPVSKVVSTPLKEAPLLATESRPTTFPIFSVNVDTTQPLRIGIFGESHSNKDDTQAFNFAVLSEILAVLKKYHAQAIFFTGNLVSPRKAVSDNLSTNAYTIGLEQELTEFSSIYNRLVGQSIPFFPALGALERRIPKSADAFAETFHLQKALNIDGELAYAVAIGPAFFVVVGTRNMIPSSKKEGKPPAPHMLEWLQKTLAMAAKEYRYLFVVGHEPAYSDRLMLSKDDVSMRDAFWKVLVDNHVLAYFSSREHYFDRSNRSGVWQIISGGGGASFLPGKSREPFFHTLLLIIPPEKTKSPTIQVIDPNGNVVEEYELQEHDAPIYELRIS